jgi:hypothetical protein
LAGAHRIQDTTLPCKSTTAQRRRCIRNQAIGCERTVACDGRRSNGGMKKGSGSISRVLSQAIGKPDRLGWPSIWDGGYPPPRATYPMNLPKRTASGLWACAQILVILFGLAPDGVCPATPVAGNAVSSYLAISPLPGNGLAAVPWSSACAELHAAELPLQRAVYFLWHFPSRCRVWPLASILSYGARTFLQGVRAFARTPQRPSNPLPI